MSIDDADVREKALCMMDEYYKNKEIADVVDGMDSECDTCIFAFEGLGDPSLKEYDDLKSGQSNTSDEHPLWLYNAMMVVTKGNKIKYITRRASTLPDKKTKEAEYYNTKKEIYETKDIGCLKEGVYNYRTGNHNSTYVALKPTNDPLEAWYRNDKGFHCGDSWGMNIHAGNHAFFNNPCDNNSEGCQLIHYKDYISFGKAVGFLKKADSDDGNECELSDIESIGNSGFSSNMNAFVGKTNETVEDCDHIHANIVTVKYILDRTFDNTNNFYAEYTNDIDDSYRNGIFYPISKQCDTEVCGKH